MKKTSDSTQKSTEQVLTSVLDLFPNASQVTDPPQFTPPQQNLPTSSLLAWMDGDPFWPFDGTALKAHPALLD